MTLNLRTAAEIKTLDPKAQDAFARFALAAQQIAAQLGFDYIMVCGNRTYAEQNRLYAVGRTTPGKKVTNARGGESDHNFGIAGDFGVFRGGEYIDETDPKLALLVHKACAAQAEHYGLTAGYYWEGFPDPPHYEIATTMTLAQKRSRFERAGSVL